MEFSEEQLYNESENDSEYSDDSQEDPTFDALEETRLTFSNLFLKKKTKTCIVKGKDENEEEERSDVIEMVVPVLDEEDRKSYENIQKIIEAGQVEKLKVEQCKIYLRKHGLRLSGNKETLILRIKEHIDIVNGGGEKKYPASSFVLNCKGDACMGDVVMFEQNVYEMFNIASRSANGPPCGTRVVAGRIVKESYGAAKQQHTFTIEVLWSKGKKPLPPLHQLLIKGRNLYRLETMRQKWDDEGERQKMLSEKHARGGVARSNREARIQQREMRKVHKPTRSVRNVSISSELEENVEQGAEEERLDFSRHEEPIFSADLKLFVGNLPFSVDSAALGGLFEQAGGVEMAEVIYDKSTGRSRGFGFVTMSSFEGARAAEQQFNGYDVEGRVLRVNSGSHPPKRENSSFGRRERTNYDDNSNRLYVGNLAWGVDNVALETLFSEHGTVKEAKVVYDKESGRSRGFGFVTYSSPEEVNNAVEALDGAGLNGRAIRVSRAEARPPRQY